MKKLIILSFITIILISASVTAFAGSIPEDLLHSDDAQIFFAEVIYYHPDKEKPDIEVSPVAVIKGDVNHGGKLTYYNPNPVGDFKVREGKIYLFTYFDENNPTDIFQTEDKPGIGIKLRNVEGDMWQRLEKYLNDGSYFNAEQERRQRLDLPLYIDNPLYRNNLQHLTTYKGEEYWKSIAQKYYNIIMIFVLPVVIGLILGICLWKIKKTYFLSGVMIIVAIIWWGILSQINTHGSEGPGLLAIMYSLITGAFVFIEVIKFIVRYYIQRRNDF